MNPIILIIGAAALLIVIVGVIMSLTGDREVQSRLEQISAPDRVVAKAAEAAKRSSPLGDLLNRALSGRGFAEGIAADLARADLKFTVGEYLATLAIVVWHFYPIIFDPDVYPLNTAFLTGISVKKQEHSGEREEARAAGDD